MTTRPRYRGQYSGGNRYVYAALVCAIAIFAFLPVIARNMPDLDAFCSWCVMATGAFLGAYYGRHGAAWRGWWSVLPFASVVLAACGPLIAVSMFGGGPDGEMATRLGAALGKVLAGAMGAVLGANLGWLCPAGNNLRWKPPRQEHHVLSVILVISFAVVCVHCAVAGPFGSGSAVLQYTAPALVAFTTVAGASLGAIYGSYKVRYGARLWFGAAVLAVLLVAFYVLPDVSLAAAWVCGDAADCPAEARSADTGECVDPPAQIMKMYISTVPIWALAFAVMVMAMEMLGAELGAHYAALLKTRDGMD